MDTTGLLGVIFWRITAKLSAAAILGSVYQGYRHKKIWPYAHVAIIATCYVIPGCIINSVGESYLDGWSNYWEETACDLLSLVVPPLLWMLLFDTFRVIALPSKNGKEIVNTKPPMPLTGTYFGYLYGFIMIIAMLAHDGLLSSTLHRPFGCWFLLIFGSKHFVYLGQWVFFGPLLVQLCTSYYNIRHILPSIASYSALLFIINMGNSIRFMPIEFPDAKLSMLLKFVLVKFMAIFALYLILAVGHTWTPAAAEKVEEKKPEVPDTIIQSTVIEIQKA